jgi:hypothetical protein
MERQPIYNVGMAGEHQRRFARRQVVHTDFTGPGVVVRYGDPRLRGIHRHGVAVVDLLIQGPQRAAGFVQELLLAVSSLNR